jgi:hypothetical protein
MAFAHFVSGNRCHVSQAALEPRYLGCTALLGAAASFHAVGASIDWRRSRQSSATTAVATVDAVHLEECLASRRFVIHRKAMNKVALALEL